MKAIFLLISVLFASGLYAQGWEELSAPVTGSRYDDVFFLNENLGWAANGWGSKVYKTTDGGQTWTHQFTAANQAYLRNIEFLNEDIGFLGTLTHRFYKTTDGGQSWNTVNIPGVQAICGLDAVGESTIYGCGAYFEPAYIIKSTDSGDNWQFMDMSDYATSLVEVLFEDEMTGYAAGGNDNGGVILKTTDGGETWEEIYNSEIPGEVVWKLQILFSNSDVMFGAVQSFEPLNGKLVKSVDHGQTWVSREVPDSYIQGVGFVTEDHGWMGGHNTGFLETFDGGQTWENTGFGSSLNRFQFFSQDLAYCAGDAIYKYTDHLSVADLSPTKKYELDIKIAPNPINDKLNIDINFERSDHMLITLFDETGRKIKQLSRDTIHQKGLKSYSFDFPYPKGVYYVLFHFDLGYQSAKIIKK